MSYLRMVSKKEQPLKIRGTLDGVLRVAVTPKKPSKPTPKSVTKKRKKED